MYPKAYRWVAEMEEIAAFLGEDAAGRDLYQTMARFYARLAADGSGEEIAQLTRFCSDSSAPERKRA
jgi:hypothetical protein